MRRSSTWTLAVKALLLASCIAYEPVACPDGRVCAPGTRCVVIAASGPEPTQQHCVVATQACDSAEPTCLLPGGEAGACHDGVCLPTGCGNARLDPLEICDDGNQLPGDGCAADCRSNELCGNAIVDPIVGEQCDDGNAFSHDGCSARCTREAPVWTSLLSGLPPARTQAAMAYDAAHGEIVLFGGTADPGASPGEMSDTWTWNGSAWRKRVSTLHPGNRYDHAMAYDGVRERVVLFGGWFNAALDDTWLWDGDRWKAGEDCVYSWEVKHYLCRQPENLAPD